MRESPPRSLDAYHNALEGLVGGIDAQGRALLAQAEAAAAAWYPFVSDNDPFMKQLENGSPPPRARAQEKEEQAEA